MLSPDGHVGCLLLVPGATVRRIPGIRLRHAHRIAAAYGRPDRPLRSGGRVARRMHQLQMYRRPKLRQ